MTRMYINAAVVLAFAAFSNAAVAEHYIFCRADTIHNYPGKTSCGWSSLRPCGSPRSRAT